MFSRRNFIKISSLSLLNLFWNSYNHVNGYEASNNYKIKKVASNLKNIGPLKKPDSNGIMLPEGFSVKIVAESGKRPITGKEFLWHDAPDGGATFEKKNDGWIYVSNSERFFGGVSALEFNSKGDLIDAYSICKGTHMNCAGGTVEGMKWLTCEETSTGQVYECDPSGKNDSKVLPALGRFKHEAVAEDFLHKHLYLTEDTPDGGFYRFIPDGLTKDGKINFSSGKLQIAVLNGDSQEGKVEWKNIKDPNPPIWQILLKINELRYQVKDSAKFNGGEGIAYYEGKIYFATKGDNKIWCYDTKNQNIIVLYDHSTHPNPILSGVDNIVFSSSGDLFVAEDGGNMQIVAIDSDGSLVPILQIMGQDESEITGPAFDPSNERLYFSSQRGKSGSASDGVTYEVKGPFIKI
tara:strand:- start:33 stop:1253 length:1221 start_codon:yes stop_codon:yes gene_type:complete